MPVRLTWKKLHGSGALHAQTKMNCHSSGISSFNPSAGSRIFLELPYILWGLHDWFSEILTNANFENFQNIVILYWNRKLPTIDPPNPSVILRPMELTDLPQVAFLDKIAFESMWVNPREKISLAFNQAEHAYVADFDGQIIGYEMTTANFFSAHLARIAIHPNFQKQHIGSELICEMFKYFRRKGIDQISVNTQNTNKSSLALYKSLGFELSEESFPVFRFRI